MRKKHKQNKRCKKNKKTQETSRSHTWLIGAVRAVAEVVVKSRRLQNLAAIAGVLFPAVCSTLARSQAAKRRRTRRSESGGDENRQKRNGAPHRAGFGETVKRRKRVKA